MGLLARFRLSYKNKKVDNQVKCQTNDESIATEMVKTYVKNKFPKAEKYKLLEFIQEK